ncbi:MAG TPA: c-type cytochrome [Bacteroidia bacterium]|nr:c-type cytochrome [Bacteroidia bacterium]
MKSRAIIFILTSAFSFALHEGCSPSSDNPTNKDGDSTQIAGLFTSDEWMAPDTTAIPQNDSGNLIRYGRALVATTGAYFGPNGKINHDANGMNCQNCHLDAGTKLYANSFSAVYPIYPKLRARSGTVEHLEKRINDCMERSMNGKKLDSLSREMRAMVAYINWVGKDVKKGVSPKGAAVDNLPYLNRAADIEKGKTTFEKYCVTCHGIDGQGKMNDDKINYLYPPLWGPNSYNTAAGMYRLSRLAGFIFSNMPNLTSSHAKPTLTEEEAWDIAAYVNSMPRPDKKFAEDWPDISKKPVDHPFGPYADTFSEGQHKYGPFGEIAEVSKKK